MAQLSVRAMPGAEDGWSGWNRLDFRMTPADQSAKGRDIDAPPSAAELVAHPYTGKALDPGELLVRYRAWSANR